MQQKSPKKVICFFLILEFISYLNKLVAFIFLLLLLEEGFEECVYINVGH